MFFRIFIYKMKEILRTRWLVGWNFLFPIVLATAFYFGFGSMISDDPDAFSVIDVGYVNEQTAGNDTFKAVLEDLSKETKAHSQILYLHEYESKEAANEALDEEKIEGFYVETNDDTEIYVASNGITSTTLTQIVKEYNNHKITIENITKDHPENLENAIDSLSADMEFLKQYDFGTGTSAYMQYFYALLAMSSFFGSWISTTILQGMCANQSECGKRFECAPGHKLVSVMAGTLAGVTTLTCSNTIVVCYINYILGLSFGAPLWNVIFITALGSALGISVGVLIASAFKNSTLLTVVPLVFSMTTSFLSGLMVGNIKQIVEYHFPILNKINPAAVFTDCLYVLSNYGKTNAYYTDIYIMCAIIIACLGISAILLGRRNYDSI
ncbi:MAG: ABC transporter permease [Lachnospiraceae bacterium]|nr:ABC transporter permease [Lachnospiraceae bacterium]